MAVASAAVYWAHLAVIEKVANSYMSRREHMMAKQKHCLGAMNEYGSEGASRKERDEIKRSKAHGLLCASNNTTSLNSALPYLANSRADVMFLQEIL